MPRAFPNPGVWCWVNALLQALASIADCRWWDVLNADTPGEDLLCALTAALRWINGLDDGESHPHKLMMKLARALTLECGMSPSAEQDVHEALLLVLEAVHSSLLRRELLAARRAPRFSCLSPLRPCLPCVSGGWAAAASARKSFLHLWRGVLEEQRTCAACGFAKVERGEAQAFRCLSLGVPVHGPGDVRAALRDAYGGQPEVLDGVYCAACTVDFSRRRFALRAGQGFASALPGLRFLNAVAVAGHASLPDPEDLRAICPAGGPELELRRAVHHRTQRIHETPHVLALHLRRLTFGPYGPVKSDAFMQYPLELRVAAPPGEQIDLAQPVSRRYVLRAVVSHLGGTSGGGHFLAHRRWAQHEPEPRRLAGARSLWHPGLDLPGGMAMWRCLEAAHAQGPAWVRADDDRVQEAPLHEVLHLRCAYLLFYERRDL